VVLKKWLKAGYVYQNELFPTDAGTPQGGIISPVAANMTLDGLEAMLAEKFPRARQRGLKMNMVRYADDCAPRRREEGGAILLSSHAA
jgi:RNA-directed DNA polymerase